MPNWFNYNTLIAAGIMRKTWHIASARLSCGGLFSTKWKIKLTALFFLPFLLIACTKYHHPLPLDMINESIPIEERITDYRYVTCEKIWNIDSENASDNPLYWLRIVDCANRLNKEQVALMVKTIQLINWQNVFRHSILLDVVEPTIAARRKIIDNLNSYSLQFASPIRPLLELWREKQIQIVNVKEANAKYLRLQQESDNKLDRLAEQNAHLTYELNIVSRKLENLTDIERQLSSRKQQEQAVSSGKMDKSSTNSTANNSVEPKTTDVTKESY
ncbi:Quorum-sensing regulator protein G [Arsenophonus endosymbiont of Aleurodicus floccissimus]|uniref:two-component system QseEF-associated lipoprotein QseG n=1 Tax=Arsenophonus endosymbiont of Aleurodicus floccissimus TaxID=2152761 RepID=UPI000E6AEA3E|nr:two-component system QseEF-associated lipoprotein QseG [Arsenophonus endosymbiont of Aleurodicus floccissimus]SPP31627.1 Quorum-sensing regulator protein G [Arsenophonus endosymbiont of Aleurodicus floccissimus]